MQSVDWRAGDLETEKYEIEELLCQGKEIQIFPQGYSMYPMFVPGRDEAVIKKADPSLLKRGDVVLYRRDHGILVLHRLWKKKAEGFYMAGDHQSTVEGPIREDQVKGILTAFIRKGRLIRVTHPLYRAAAYVWLFLLPYRRSILAAGAAVRKKRKKVEENDNNRTV